MFQVVPTTFEILILYLQFMSSTPTPIPTIGGVESSQSSSSSFVDFLIDNQISIAIVLVTLVLLSCVLIFYIKKYITLSKRLEQEEQFIENDIESVSEDEIGFVEKENFDLNDVYGDDDPEEKEDIGKDDEMMKRGGFDDAFINMFEVKQNSVESKALNTAFQKSSKNVKTSYKENVLLREKLDLPKLVFQRNLTLDVAVKNIEMDNAKLRRQVASSTEGGSPHHTDTDKKENILNQGIAKYPNNAFVPLVQTGNPDESLSSLHGLVRKYHHKTIHELSASLPRTNHPRTNQPDGPIKVGASVSKYLSKEKNNNRKKKVKEKEEDMHIHITL